MTSDNVAQKGGHALKRIAISIRNRVFAESILFMLKQTGEFHPVRLPSVWPERILIECRSIQPEILLMDVTPAQPETTIEGRLKMLGKLHQEFPECKSVMLCDETAYPELAQDVMHAKQSRLIDGFFYASVTTGYLVASLSSL